MSVGALGKCDCLGEISTTGCPSDRSCFVFVLAVELELALVLALALVALLCDRGPIDVASDGRPSGVIGEPSKGPVTGVDDISSDAGRGEGVVISPVAC